MNSASEIQPQSTRASNACRRVFDIMVSFAALIGLCPLMLMIALAIVLDSGRPILFSQLRLGQHGRPFRMYKFRKFHSDRSANGLQLTLAEDSRLTTIGRIMRSTKLDELPQFWNVLIGDDCVGKF